MSERQKQNESCYERRTIQKEMFWYQTKGRQRKNVVECLCVVDNKSKFMSHG